MSLSLRLSTLMRNKVSYPSWGRLGQPFGSEKRSHVSTATSGMLWMSHRSAPPPSSASLPAGVLPSGAITASRQGEILCLVSVVMV